MDGLSPPQALPAPIFRAPADDPSRQPDRDRSRAGPTLHLEAADRFRALKERLAHAVLDRRDDVRRHRAGVRDEHSRQLPIRARVGGHAVRYARGLVSPLADSIAALLREMAAGRFGVAT